MQVVVERGLRQDNPFEAGKPNYACCSVLAMSPVFTPAANAVTQIPVNFRVRQDLTPDENGIYVSDQLALSVLAPNVPIPAALDGQASVGIWYPAWQAVGEQRAGRAGGSQLNVLMNADWDPVGSPAAPPPGTSPAAPGAVRAVSIPNRQALVRNGLARLALRCGLDRNCVGRVLLQNRVAGGGARASAALLARPAKRTVTYGSAKFRIKPGKRLMVRVKLNRKGKRLTNKRARAKVWVNLKMKDQAPPSKRITLKRAPRR